jgi:hypothetical protein
MTRETTKEIPNDQEQQRDDEAAYFLLMSSSTEGLPKRYRATALQISAGLSNEN